MPLFTLTRREHLYYEVHGSGPPLFLVSGLSGVASFWSQNVDALARHFTVIVHDQRGIGQSSPSRIVYSVDQMADDTLQLIDGLGYERVHLIGHSTGGAIGQTLAIDRPERIDRLVLSATWTKSDPYFRRMLEMRAEILREIGTEAYIRFGAISLKPSWWVRDNDATIDAEVAAALAKAPAPEIVLSRIAAILEFDRREELARIVAPTLVIGARDDTATPTYFSEELGSLIPDARTVILPMGEHFFPQIFPEAFGRIVVEFLDPTATGS